MELAVWIPGVVVIVVGILGCKYPQCINMFSKEDKMKMDLVGVGKLFRNVFVTIGILLILAASFFPKSFMPLIAVFIPVGIFVFAAKAEKYKNRK